MKHRTGMFVGASLLSILVLSGIGVVVPAASILTDDPLGFSVALFSSPFSCAVLNGYLSGHRRTTVWVGATPGVAIIRSSLRTPMNS